MQTFTINAFPILAIIFALVAIAALPGALFSVWHNLSGALLAQYWKGK